MAIHGAAEVRRHTPGGALREVLTVPTEQTTCCAFAGPGLHRLYVTAPTEGWSEVRRQAEPAAGLVYRVDTNATGRPAAPFIPDLTWWQKVAARS